LSFRASLRSIWNCLFSTNHSIYRLFMRHELRTLVLNFMFNLLNVSKGKNILSRTECWKHEEKYPFMHLLDMLPSWAERRIKLLCPFQITFLFFLLALFSSLALCVMNVKKFAFSFTIKSVTVVNSMHFESSLPIGENILFFSSLLCRNLRRGKKLDRRIFCVQLFYDILLEA